jgi:hypothetical protein
MVEMQERQNYGKRARASEKFFGIDALKIRFEKFGRQAFCPFVEIARDDAFSRKFRMFEDVRVEKFVNLPAAFEKRCTEMNVEKLQSLVPAERDFGQKTAARFVFVNADVEILLMFDGQTAQHGVAVESFPDSAVFAQEKIHIDLFGNKFRLMLAFLCACVTQNFLQTDHVGVNFAQHFRDSFGRKPAVDPDAFVNIVGRNANFIHNLFYFASLRFCGKLTLL